MEGAIPLISEFLSRSSEMRAVSRRWRSELEFDDRLFLRALASKYGSPLTVAVYKAVSSDDVRAVNRVIRVLPSLIPTELRGTSFWDRMSYITFSKDILRAIYTLVSQGVRMRLDMLLGNPLSQYALGRIRDLVRNLPKYKLLRSAKAFDELMRDSMDYRVLEKFFDIAESENLADSALRTYVTSSFHLYDVHRFFKLLPSAKLFAKGNMSMGANLTEGMVSAIASYMDDPTLIISTGIEPNIVAILVNQRGPNVTTYVAKRSDALRSIDMLPGIQSQMDNYDPKQSLFFLNQVINLNSDINTVNSAIAYSIRIGAYEIANAHMNKSNAIDTVSRLYEPIDLSWANKSLHPDWFMYYLKGQELKSPITDPLFWRKLLAAAIRNSNQSLVNTLISRHWKEITPEMKKNMLSIASPSMRQYLLSTSLFRE